MKQILLFLTALASVSAFSQISSFPYIQDFESFTTCNANCGLPCALAQQWSNDTGDDADWITDFGGTPSPNTGPAVDQNPGNGTGNYLYVESTGGSCLNATANLVSPYFDFTGFSTPIVSFWYHMFGDSMGTMHLDVDTNGTWVLDVVPSWTDNQDLWQKREFIASSVGNKNNVRFRIRGITGTFPSSDMAVDDFRIILLEPNDAGVSQILEPGISCPGVVNVKVRVKNFGTNTINTVAINWEINSAPQTTFNLATPIPVGDSLDVVIGTLNLVAGNTYTIDAWTSLPNGVSDPQTANDMASRSGIQSALTGSYTIGGASPSYSGFADALNALHTYGVCGPVVFNVRNGTYNEQLLLSNISGTSAANSITFQSENGDSSLVTISFNAGSTANYVVRLDTQSHITFKDLTFMAVGVTYAVVADIRGGSHYNRFLNNHLIGTAGGTTSTLKTLITTSSVVAGNSYNEFRNNRMENGSNGFVMNGALAEYDTGTVIQNNIIYCFASGVNLRYHHAPDISYNTIKSNIFASYTASSGIVLNNISGQFMILENNINVQTGAYGFQFQNCTADVGSEALVANNMVHVGGTSTGYGIFTTQTTNNINFYYNTINLSNANVNNGRGIYNNSSGVNLRYVNNIVANIGGGQAFFAPQISSIVQSDYNDLYSSGPFLGRWGSQNQADLPAWQSASGHDANSVSVDPGFLSNNDLHVLSAGIDGKATPIAGITTDIDGDLRHATQPDIGGDEFTPPDKELSVIEIVAPVSEGCHSATTQCTILIFNNGLQPQSNFTVGYKVYSITVATETVTATINSGDSLLYTFATTVDISTPGHYPFTAWVDLSGDANPFNDTLLGHLVSNTGIVDQFPYIEDFELQAGTIPLMWTNESSDGTEDWFFDNTTGGFPIPNGIGTDHTTGTPAGYYAWVDDNSPHNATVGLLTPCIDLSGVAGPLLEFYYWNPYSNPSIVLHVDVFDNDEWDLDIVPAMGSLGLGWERVLITLDSYAGKSVKLRFRAEETNTVSNQDIAIDDVRIFTTGQFNTSVIDVVHPTTECNLGTQENITIDIWSVGGNTLNPGTQIPVGYQVNGGTVVNETLTLASAVMQYDTVSYTFTASEDFSANGQYDIVAWTSLPNDDDNLNDTIWRTIFNNQLTTFPADQDFEAFTVATNATGFADGWEAQPTNTTVEFRWNVDLAGTPNFNTGPSVDHTLGTVQGKYIYVEASNGAPGDTAILSRACVDFGSLANPGVNFWYHMFGVNMGSLSVDVIDGSAVLHRDLWIAQGDQGDVWRKASVQLGAFAGQDITLRFRATKVSGVLGDLAIDDVRVGEVPALSFPDTIWDCGFVALDAGNPGATYEWSTGGNAQIEHVGPSGPTPDVQTVSVVVTNADGLCAEDSLVLVIDEGPFVNLGVDTLVCGGTSLTLNAGNAGATFLWDDASTNQVRTVTTDGTYHVSVTSAGCAKADTITVDFEQFPVASFSANQVTQFEYSFTNNSQHAQTILWDFGDGFTSTLPDPTHIYVSGGVYTVKLVITNACGSDSTTQQVTIVGVEDVSWIEALNVYPNPADDHVTIAFVVTGGQTISLRVTDEVGRLVYGRELGRVSGSLEERVSTRGWPAGSYRVELLGELGVVTRSIVVTH